MFSRLGVGAGFAAALLASSLLGGLGVRTAQAQELDRCNSTAPTCVRIEEFNFSDPVLGLNSRYQLRSDAVYITTSSMRTASVPQERSAEDGAGRRSRTTLSLRGDYPGENGRELYCIVFARSC